MGTSRPVKMVMIIGALLSFCVEGAFAETYSIINLGSLNGVYSGGVYEINNRGQVTGFNAKDNNSYSRAFFYIKGETTDIGTLGGVFSVGSGINDAGQIVGQSTMVGEQDFHAFIYSKGTMTDLGTLGGTVSFATAINNAGQVTGSSHVAGDTNYNAFLYNKGAMTALGTLGGSYSSGSDINNSGQITGCSQTAQFIDRAFLYTKGVMYELSSLLNNGMSHGVGINDAGDVVGYSDAAYVEGNSNIGLNTYHAFLYSKGIMIDLGTPGCIHSFANAINNSGQVVGYGYNDPSAFRTAFLYSDGVMKDLNSLLPNGSGWYLSEATDINDSGQIIGRGLLNGVPHAYVMTPHNKGK